MLDLILVHAFRALGERLAQRAMFAAVAEAALQPPSTSAAVLPVQALTPPCCTQGATADPDHQHGVALLPDLLLEIHLIVGR